MDFDIEPTQIEATQVDEATQPEDLSDVLGEFAKEVNDVWGFLRCKGGGIPDIELVTRVKDGISDTYFFGRSNQCDIVVTDNSVSSWHCKIFCDYSQARLRIFVEDTSTNGTFINNSLTRITKGERMELKSGDEIYLKTPTAPDIMKLTFMFVNVRDRLVVNRTKSIASVQPNTNPIQGRHIEQSYVIGEALGSGMCGQVHMCVHRGSGMKYAVKIIDTKKFAMTPGLSPKELMEEAEMMRRLDHPNIVKVSELIYGRTMCLRTFGENRWSDVSTHMIDMICMYQ